MRILQGLLPTPIVPQTLKVSVAAILCAVACTSCSQGSDSSSLSRDDASSTRQELASETAETSKSAESAESAERAVRSLDPPGKFHGYTCTDDCSGHEAGYQWAEDHEIDDPDNCGGNSESFIEGCRAYADEQSEDASADHDDSQ
jgi:hypothetical protein